MWYNLVEKEARTMFNPTRLKELREKVGLSQEKFMVKVAALGLSLSRETVSSWENGDTCPDVNELSILSQFFDKPVSYFFDQKR